MSDPQQPPTSSVGQISPDGQFQWNGSAWVPNPNLPKPKKKHTVRNVFIGVSLAGILMVGGCLALIGGAANEIDKSIKADQNQKGGKNNPLDIEIGEAFVIGDTSYAAGWKVGNDVLGSAEIVGLTVTNTGDDTDFPSVDFRFWDGTTILAEVTCGLLEEVPAGTSQKLDCSGDEPLPKKYDRFTVSNSS